MSISPPQRTRLVSHNGSAAPPRYQPLVLVAAALAAGIVADRFGPSPTNWAVGEGAGIALFWCVFAAVLWAGWLALRGAQRNRLAAMVLLLSVAACGATWHHIRWNAFGRQEVGRYADSVPGPVCLEGIAIEQPARVSAPPETPFRAIPQGERTRLLIRVVSLRDGTAWTSASGVAQLTVDGHLLGVRAGDRLRVFGQMRRIAPPSNPGEFDFAADARAERRLANVNTGTPDAVRIVKPRRSWSFARSVDRARAGGQRILRQYVGDERAALASAILLGKRDGLTDDLTDRFRLTGTIHLLVVSGLHVGIVAAGLYGLKRTAMVPRIVALAAIVTTVVCYALLTGANPPVIRAAVLAVLVCLAAWSGRYVVAMNSLAAAAIVVLALNPSELFRVGPQLSFLAVATLIQFGWYWQRRRATVDPLRRLVEESRPWPIRATRTFWRWNLALLVATCAVWLVAMPLIMNRLHLVSPAAVVVSPLLWPLVSGALLAGLGVLLCSQVAPPLATLCGIACDTCLAGLDNVIHLAHRMPGGYFWVSGPPDWWIVGFYLGVAWFFCGGARWMLLRWRVGLLSAWIIAGFVPTLAAELRRAEQLECEFLAMGHGCCVVLHTPDGQTVLYDAGSLGSPEFATDTVSNYLWERGTGRIDAIVLSHADLDHYSAVPGLCERFDIGAVYVSPVMFDRFGASANDQSAPQALRRTLADNQIPVHEIWSGDRLRLGELAIHVLHPPREGTFGSDNSDSVTLAIDYAGRRVLLPGDLESPGLDGLLAELPYDTDLLLAPHHGSRRSDPPGLAAWATPEFVVISGSGGADAEGVGATYAAAGAQVARTDLAGAIRVAVQGDGSVSLSTWRSGTAK